MVAWGDVAVAWWWRGGGERAVRDLLGGGGGVALRELARSLEATKDKARRDQLLLHHLLLGGLLVLHPVACLEL